MIYLNQEKLKDKMYACWLGKNIGGTIGTPFEGKRQINHITGFTSPKGEPLPNDDLDLQLGWLDAIEKYGAERVNEGLLGEVWLDYITPHWSEYGICKANMRSGLLPPLSGEYNNPWKDSNGAWIRTEIWASLMPACPNTAIRYSYYDACVDHGMAEGTMGAIFVEAMESAAYVISDLRELIDIGLSKIPADSRVARAVRTAVAAYDSGVTWEEACEQVREDSRDIGWFEAPANIAYTVIGLLYGEGDFKKTICVAVGCGDDTDCTGATAGSLMGIMYGTAIIPKDWQEYIGDRIITISLNNGDMYPRPPATCEELTRRVMAAGQEMARRGGVTIGDGPDSWTKEDLDAFRGREFVEEMLSVSRYNYRGNFGTGEWLVEYDRQPDVAPGESIRVKLTLHNPTTLQQSYDVHWLLPEGWTVSGRNHLTTFTAPDRRLPDGGCVDIPATFAKAVGEYVITAPEQVEPVNRLVAEVTQTTRPHVAYIPVMLMG